MPTPSTGSGELVADAGEVRLAYETFGERADRALLMIMGLGAQMILWHDELCERLATEGFFVVRFDNRDCGRSTILDELGEPSLSDALAGDVALAPYSLSAMAADAAGLLDTLGIDAAHVVGSSAGGMIAQTLAIEHPERVLSLTSIMSTTGERGVGMPNEVGMAALTSPAPSDRDDYIEATVANRLAIGSPGFAHDEDYMRKLAARAFDRGIHPAGTLRQTLAIVATGDRTPGLGKLEIPTAVIHGDADPVVNLSGGIATAEAIPGATLLIIPGLGHDLPRGAWPEITAAISATARARSSG